MPATVFAFDAYGTLFDVHAAVRRHAAAVGPDATALSDMWRTKQLEYTWLRTLSPDWDLKCRHSALLLDPLSRDLSFDGYYVAAY